MKSSEYHITPLKTYLIVGLALFFLTIVTVAVSYIDLGPLNLVVALSIASIKAILVALFFMHLWWDNKLYFLIFTIAILFLAVFIIFTLFDVMTRGDLLHYTMSIAVFKWPGQGLLM